MKKIIFGGFTFLFFIGSTFAVFIFSKIFFLPYSDEGEFFDGLTVSHKQTLEVIGIGIIFFIVAFLLSSFVFYRSIRAKV